MGKEQRLSGVIRVGGGDFSARGARRPAVFIIKPGQHLILFRLIHTVADIAHELLIQIGAVHAGAHMHVKAAHAHFVEHIDLAGQGFAGELSIPSPKGRATIFAGGIQEKAVLQSGRLILWVEHREPILSPRMRG